MTAPSDIHKGDRVRIDTGESAPFILTVVSEPHPHGSGEWTIELAEFPDLHSVGVKP